MTGISTSVTTHFAALPDPRVDTPSSTACWIS